MRFDGSLGRTKFVGDLLVHFTMGDQFEGRVATKDDNTYLIAPNGITLKAENVKDLGVEPRTQAHIFGLTGTNYNIQLTGAEIATAENSGGDQQEGGPQIQPILPRIYTQVLPIMAIALGILGLGFVLLYRKEAPDRK